MRGIALGCAAILAAASAAFAQYTVGPSINIDRLTGNQAEGAIALDPTNAQRLFAFSNPSSGNSLTGGFSTDGGTTWTTRSLATGADGLASACCDPSCAFDNFGNLFICYINSAISAVIVGISTNGGASFTQLAAFSGSVDQPTLTVGANTVWVTYNLGGTINARGAAISGLGSVGAFGAAQAVTGGTGNFGDIAIGPAGQVIVAYENPSGGQTAASLFVALDANGLAAGGFAAPTVATTTNVGGFDFIPPQPNRSVDAEVGFAWDRSPGPFNGRLYMVYTEEPVDESNNTDIRLRISNNNGTTWSAPVTLNTDGTTRAQFLPRIAIDQSTGHVAVIWYDARNDAANVRSEIWGTASIDGGASWLPNVKISAGASQSTTAGSVIDFGDYIGLTMYNDTFYPIWADNSNSTGNNPNGANAAFDQYTAKVTILVGSCCASGVCSSALQSGCTGTWTLGASCTPNPCPPVGSCCISGACSVTISSACSGLWTLGGTCTPNLCAQPTGSCCTAGLCTVTTQAACLGSWTSAGVCAPSPCAPANDNCSSATALSLGIVASGTNVNANTSTTIVDTTICGQTTAAQSTLDVFWSFTAPATAAYTIDTCGSSFDTVLTVHTACPATDANKIACNDDSSINTACSGSNLHSRIPSVTLTAGAVYTIRVAGFNGATGTISLLVNNLAPFGACCAGSSCSSTDAANCPSGSFFSAGAVCSPNACLSLTGACCTGSHCASTTVAGCAGVFQGFAVACGAPGNPTTCCPANYNGVNGLDVADIFDFLSGWFAGQPAADFNHDSATNVTDIFNFLSAWFAGCA